MLILYTQLAVRKSEWHSLQVYFAGYGFYAFYFIKSSISGNSSIFSFIIRNLSFIFLILTFLRGREPSYIFSNIRVRKNFLSRVFPRMRFYVSLFLWQEIHLENFLSSLPLGKVTGKLWAV